MRKATAPEAGEAEDAAALPPTRREPGASPGQKASQAPPDPEAGRLLAAAVTSLGWGTGRAAAMLGIGPRRVSYMRAGRWPVPLELWRVLLRTLEASDETMVPERDALAAAIRARLEVAPDVPQGAPGSRGEA